MIITMIIMEIINNNANRIIYEKCKAIRHCKAM